MNINGINRAMRVYDIQNNQKTEKSVTNTKKRDELNLSSSAMDYKFAMEKIKDVSDIREDKVAEIKSKIESGEYKIDADAIADKIYKMSKGEF